MTATVHILYNSMTFSLIILNSSLRTLIYLAESYRNIFKMLICKNEVIPSQINLQNFKCKFIFIHLDVGEASSMVSLYNTRYKKVYHMNRPCYIQLVLYLASVNQVPQDVTERQLLHFCHLSYNN